MANVAVIVNADDLGMSHEVNDATFKLMSRGRISSATIMANAPATRDAARFALHFPTCSFGVHLNLTQFEPLTAGPGARLLVDDRGCLSRANERVWPGRKRLRAMYEELCAQVERVASLGVCITHLDSHHHVHTRPHLLPILNEVQKRYRIAAVRLTKNFYSADQPCPARLRWKKHAYNWALRLMCARQTTDAFTEFLTYHRADAERKRSIRQIELMVHPGAPGSAEESTILASDWTTRSEVPMELISYAELPAYTAGGRVGRRSR
jgi:predicted glycoside hydrolase/deacetylase ChbG (UPF0249 family)